jgi:hypothetical protein
MVVSAYAEPAQEKGHEGKSEKPQARPQQAAQPRAQQQQHQQPQAQHAQAQQRPQARQETRQPAQQSHSQQQARQPAQQAHPQQQARQPHPESRPESHAVQARQQQQPHPTRQESGAWQQQRGWAKNGGWPAHNSWQGGRSEHWDRDHRTWAQRGGYGGFFIPQAAFSVSFGSQHWFRMHGRPTMYMGYPRFSYGGYSFMLVDPWPENWANNWYDNDDVYIDYDNGYYLHNRRHPGVGIAVTVAM